VLHIRYAEWLGEAFPAKEERPLADPFGERYQSIAAKLLADVCGFLVTTAGLDEEFRARSRKLLAPVNGELDNTEPREGDSEQRGSGPSASGGQSRLPLNNPGTSGSHT